MPSAQPVSGPDPVEIEWLQSAFGDRFDLVRNPCPRKVCGDNDGCDAERAERACDGRGDLFVADDLDDRSVIGDPLDKALEGRLRLTLEIGPWNVNVLRPFLVRNIGERATNTIEDLRACGVHRAAHHSRNVCDGG